MRTRIFRSESFRHAAIYAALFVGSTAILVTVVYLVINQAFRADLLRASGDDLLAIRMAYVAGLPRGKGIHEAEEMIEDRMLAPDAADRFLLQQGAGTKLAGNLPAMAPKAGTFYLRYPGSREGDDHLILGKGAFLSNNVFAFVGRDTYAARQTERGILQAFGLVLLGSLVLASFSGLFLSRNFLKRIDAITNTCEAIMAGQLGDRIPIGKNKGELERLAAAINAMLDRIQILMDSLRQVSTDIAHDLRTPLTHMRYRLEQARAGSATTEQYASALEGAIADSDQLLSIFSALLRIAQIEAGARVEGFRDVDLAELLQQASDIYRPVMDDMGRPFTVHTAVRPRVNGDPELLLQLVANLLDNALSHTPARTPITIEAGEAGDFSFMRISDAGPGIPAEDRQKVFRRFYRRERSRTSPGSGLGLALVLAIADLHAAQIELSDNMPGLRVIVVFPRSSSHGG